MSQVKTHARVKDLTAPQARIWRAARAYALAEVNHSRTTEWSGLPAMADAQRRRQRAASRLFQLIQTALIVDPEE